MYLAYDGTRYHGWQVQPNSISVEGEIERCLSVVMRRHVDIVGAGRTDAGVHARLMAAHFDASPEDFPRKTAEGGSDEENLTYKLNRILPPDISIYRIERVDDDMHARFSAVSRTYHYYVSLRRDPFDRAYSWLTHYDLDFALMNEAAGVLMEYEDFACFCKSHTDVKTTLCRVMEAGWVQVSPCKWYFRIKANRFLRNMVRAVVGTLIEVGRHRLSVDDFRRIIEEKRRSEAGESMPGNALFLEEVAY